MMQLEEELEPIYRPNYQLSNVDLGVAVSVSPAVPSEASDDNRGYAPHIPPRPCLP
jgi:hypothetical protein